MDALDRRLITRADYGKSKILKAAAPDLAEPLTHCGLTHPANGDRQEYPFR